ncbi:carbohydrate-binding protein [Halothermothrix orenii]|uniref:Carbohydrate binding family 25 n=1 Tax=Halothermothrix orenii (strain H 168 / OCM 544 / DSM 9562) TaxID=373903 RepID=B8CYI2_HALOH|nr:carbohydrate-binding protein [Halothermothrix orenii]ACL70351.1 Carbohydrate binding family 25 [Halothermothrix orenii H 168]
MSHNDQGIEVNPTPMTAGETVQVRYNGLLARSGAEEVYLHYGFGTDKHWDEVKDIKMSKVRDQFQTNIDVETDKRFIFCFRDNAGNWDNNNGRNWSFEVHNGSLY